MEDERAWYATVVPRLVAVCKRAARKYTASRVRKALPAEFAYIIEELMNEDNHGVDKEAYYAGILDAAVRTGRGIALIEALAQLIQRLAIRPAAHHRRHLRPRPAACTSSWTTLHGARIMWTSSGATTTSCGWAPLLGQRGCIAHVVRNCARYGNLSILEDAYGINILPLGNASPLDAYA